MKEKRKSCRCKIFGIVKIWRQEKDFALLLHPASHEKYLRKFKYCPLCGAEISWVQS